MNIAICFSGEIGNALASELREWLDEVLGVDAFFAPHDIAKGERWFDELDRALSRADATLLCLTDDDPGPWLFWEAGHARRPYPVAFGFEPKKVLEGPLGRHQLTMFTVEDFQQLMASLNVQKGGPRRNAASLKRAVRSSWRRLAARVGGVLQRRPRSFQERICGAWWERVEGDGGHDCTTISFIRILPSNERDTVRLHGFGYDRDGRSSSEWHSEAVFAHPAELSVKYEWQGTARGACQGIGEIRFSGASDGDATGGNGSFSNDDGMGNYRKQRFTLFRATDEERAAMDGGDERRRAAAVRERIQAGAGVSGSPSAASVVAPGRRLAESRRRNARTGARPSFRR